MPWPANKKHSDDTIKGIKETRKAQERAKPRETREAQNAKIAASVKATRAAKKNPKKN